MENSYFSQLIFFQNLLLDRGGASWGQGGMPPPRRGNFPLSSGSLIRTRYDMYSQRPSVAPTTWSILNIRRADFSMNIPNFPLFLEKPKFFKFLSKTPQFFCFWQNNVKILLLSSFWQLIAFVEALGAPPPPVGEYGPLSGKSWHHPYF